MENNEAFKETAPMPIGEKEGAKLKSDERNSDWQASKSSMKERHAFMFNNELQADVHFIVGSGSDQRRIPAHKYMLFTGSSVFYAMLCGGLAEDNRDILIPDVKPQAFLNLLRYLYCDEISLQADTVLPTLYAAKKYIMPHLERACVKYLETNVDASNACLLLSQSRLFDESKLMKSSLDVIDSQAEKALKSDSFTDIDYKTLEQILSRDTLCVKESVVYAAASRWAKAECIRQGRDASPQQCREVLGDALYLLRFPTMTLDDFANGAGRSELLSNREIIDIFLYLTAKDKPKLRFPTTWRKGRFMCCRRFQATKEPWSYSGNRDSIQFSVDRAITLVGFGLYGSCQDAVEYQADIAFKQVDSFSETVFLQMQHKVVSDGSSKTIHVLFDYPVQIEAYINYTAALFVKSKSSGFYGADGMSTVSCGNVNFTFFGCPESTNDTGVGTGQIPEILFRLADH